MKKILVMATCMVLLLAGAAQADILKLGSNYTPIHFTYDSSNYYVGGGSYGPPSSWNGTPLNFVYCVDLFHNISVPGTYSLASATATGVVNGALVNNAGEVAWLLDHYGTGGNGDAAYALQVAIWHVIYDGYGGHTLVIDSSHSSANANTLYTNMLAALGSQTSVLSSYLWITPAPGGRNNWYYEQGLVASVHSVPEAGALILFGTGLIGLVGYRRVRRMK